MKVLEISGREFFSMLGPDGEDERDFLLVQPALHPVRRWIAIGGTVSKVVGNSERIHLRVEVFEPGQPPVFERDIYRDDTDPTNQLALSSLTEPLPDLAAVQYRVRVRTMGSARLDNKDSFWVVAIDLDDGIDDSFKLPAGAGGPTYQTRRGPARPTRPAGGRMKRATRPSPGKARRRGAR